MKEKHAKSSIHHRFFDIIRPRGKTQKGGAASKGYATNGYAKDLLQLIFNKKEFLIKVFATLITQLGITYYVMTNYQTKEESDSNAQFWGIFMAQITIVFVLALVPMPMFVKLFLFSVFSAGTGVLFSHINKKLGHTAINNAILGTCGVFASMMFFGIFLILFGIKLGYQFGLWLWLSLLMLIIFQITALFTGTYSKIFAAVGLLIFSLYVIYDTNKILQREYYGDFITAAMDYYLDFINIFLDIANLSKN